MKKEAYEAWLKMDLTKQVFKLWTELVEWQNKELVSGNLLGKDKFSADVNYYSMVGYNKAFRDMKEFSYEQLVGENEYVEQEGNDEDGNEKAN